MVGVERIKETLGWLKLVFAALVAIDMSLVAWLAQNLLAAGRVLVVVAASTVVATTVGVIAVNHAAFRCITKLGNI